MADTLIPIDLPPGMFRNGTTYQSRGRWFDGSLARFFSKTIAPIGGWRVMQDDSGSNLQPLDGVPRGVLGWRGATGDRLLALGTTKQLYLLSGGTLRAITPAGFVPASSADTAYATASGAYGAGAYGSGSFGVGSATAVLVETSNWLLDNFGNFLAAVSTSDNKLYVWAGDPAVAAAEVTGAGHPAFVRGCVVTPEGFLVGLGWQGGVANVRGVAWASQRTSSVWTAAITNSAGDFELATSGRVLTAKRTRSETLIWTDVDLHVMEYIGGPLVYRFAQAGEKCGAISPRSPVVFDTKAMWMGQNNFFVYDGSVRSIDCDVADYVFNDFNVLQATKVWGTTLAEFGEAWWFYPSAASTEVDRYVVYNYRENHWTVGKLRRSAGADAGALASPVLASPQGVVFEHEIATVMPDSAGTDNVLFTEAGIALSTESGNYVGEEAAVTPADAGLLVPYLESGPVQLGEGDRLLSAQRIVPDEKTLGDVNATLYATNYPTDPETTYGPYSLANPTPVRLMARQIRLRLAQVRATAWRVGQIRLGVKPGARR